MKRRRNIQDEVKRYLKLKRKLGDLPLALQYSNTKPMCKEFQSCLEWRSDKKGQP